MSTQKFIVVSEKCNICRRMDAVKVDAELVLSGYKPDVYICDSCQQQMDNSPVWCASCGAQVERGDICLSCEAYEHGQMDEQIRQDDEDAIRKYESFIADDAWEHCPLRRMAEEWQAVLDEELSYKEFDEPECE